MPPQLQRSERPHTRAWTRAQSEAAKHNGQPSTVDGHTRQSKRKGASAEQNPAEEPQPKRRVQPKGAHQQAEEKFTPSRPLSDPDNQSDHTSGRNKATQLTFHSLKARAKTKVPLWLQSVRSVSPDRIDQERSLYLARVPGGVSEASHDMYSNSPSRESKVEESTAARIFKGWPMKLTDDKLRLRRVQRKATADAKADVLRTKLRTTPPELSMKDIPELEAAAMEFVQKIRNNSSDSCGDLIEEFSLLLDQEKRRLHYPVVNRTYFDAQVKKCLSRNEAVLQRTVMMSVFHHYWLGSMFDWNAEAQWSQPQDLRLPSQLDDEIVSPKPDLAINFTLESFTGDEDDSDPMPQDLVRSIRPDGGEQCFPFLFMEVKKAGADLQEAYLANLHTASQALYNMWLWMSRVQKEDIFFEHVRVFSLVFNAQHLSVRVHRAYRLADGALSFRFDEFYPLANYTRDGVCSLVDTTINYYAAEELHGILLDAYRAVILDERERIVSKRKAAAVRQEAPRKLRRSGVSGQFVNGDLIPGEILKR